MQPAAGAQPQLSSVLDPPGTGVLWTHLDRGLDARPAGFSSQPLQPSEALGVNPSQDHQEDPLQFKWL